MKLPHLAILAVNLDLTWILLDFCWDIRVDLEWDTDSRKIWMVPQMRTDQWTLSCWMLGYSNWFTGDSRFIQGIHLALPGLSPFCGGICHSVVF
jgi:hypothetical protein